MVIEDANTSQLQVTFVHGTWGSRSRWFRSRSPMWRAFEAEGAHCHEFFWSGRNSHIARTRAAESLAEHLCRLDPGGVGVPLAVVAHSHGGNAALHAAWRLRPEASSPIKLVTLATPYFFAKRKSQTSAIDTVASTLVFVYMAAVLVAVAFAADKSMATPTTLPAAVVAVFVLGLRCLGWLYFRIAQGAPRDDDIRERVVASIQTPEIPARARAEDLLVIRAADDEAGGLLGAAQFSGWLGFTGTRLARPARLILLIWAAGFVLYAVGSSGYGPFGIDALPLAGFVADWTFTAFGLLVVLLALPAISALAHGWDGPSTSTFAVVTAEASPPGNSLIWQREIRDTRANGLAHSSLYDDPAVIDRVIAHATVSDGFPTG